MVKEEGPAEQSEATAGRAEAMVRGVMRCICPSFD
jgi:hypothetical protein